MLVGVLTYDVPHRKSQDVLFQLKAFGYTDVRLVVTHFEERKAFVPLIQHRPVSCVMLSPFQIAENFGYEVVGIEAEAKNPECDIYIIAGAGILKEPWTTNGITINSHPGYIPNVRGLDAFKWAVWEGQPIGVTVHVIDDSADLGKLVDRSLVELKPTDTFHAVAYRQYELEIEMLIASIQPVYLKHCALEPMSRFAGQYEVKRRMPHSKEMFLLERFEKLLDAVRR